jgi:hypothetical protein
MLQRSAAAAARGAHHVLLPPTPRAVMTASTASHALAQICRTVHARAIHPPRTAALPQMQTLSLSNPEDTPPILPSFSEEKALKSHRDLHNYEVPAEPPSVAQIFGKMSINWSVARGRVTARRCSLQLDASDDRLLGCHCIHDEPIAACEWHDCVTSRDAIGDRPVDVCWTSRRAAFVRTHLRARRTSTERMHLHDEPQGESDGVLRPSTSELFIDLRRSLPGFFVCRFPGHMHAAKLALQERVSKCHLVLEVRDARVSEHSWGLKPCTREIVELIRVIPPFPATDPLLLRQSGLRCDPAPEEAHPRVQQIRSSRSSLV